MTGGLILALATLACGGEEVSPPPTSSSGSTGTGGSDCPAPSRIVGERCLGPGQQDDGCMAGEVFSDGICVSAGAPPDGCPDGMALADGRCEALLVDACPEGFMAPPGATRCRRPMECGSGKWGDIPVDADTVYVDASYVGGDADGSEAKPHPSVSAAVGSASPGAVIAIAEGDYDGPYFVFESVKLWGVCPEKVTIHHDGALALILEADGVELHGVTLRGGGLGLGPGDDVVVDGVHIVDTPNVGLIVGANLQAEAPTRAVLRSVLVERATGTGVVNFGGEMELDSSEIRATAVSATEKGLGVGTQPRLGSTMRPTSWIHHTRIDGSTEAGLFTVSADALIESVSIDATKPTPSETLGYGVAVQAGSEPSDVDVHGLHVRGSYTGGVFVHGSVARLDTVTIEETLPQPSTEGSGNGLVIAPGDDGTASIVDATWGYIAASHEAGVAVTNSSLVMSGFIVRTTAAIPGGELGHGFSINGAGATLDLLGSVVRSNTAMGVQIDDATASLLGVVIEGTASSPAGLYGDGAVVVSSGSGSRGSLDVTACVISDSLRAGLSSFGADATVESSALDCNAIALVAEPHAAESPAVEDGGSNRCGCGDVPSPCKVQSARLVPPLALPQPPDAVEPQ